MLKKIVELNQYSGRVFDNKGENGRSVDLSGKDRMVASENKIKESNIQSYFETWKPLGRLPNGTRNMDTKYVYSVRINRYLRYQESRIIEAISKKQYQKAALIGMVLLKNSFGYQLCLFNKVMPQGHYLLNYREAKLLLQKIVNKCRTNDLHLDLSRFYILKADGKRGRPIGAPDYPSRVISRSLNDLIYILFEDKFNKVQHGFRKNRGAHTALLEIIQKLKKHPQIIYEFDLKSYFNTVRPMGVYRSLLARSSLLAEVVYKILMQIRYKLPAEVSRGEEIVYKKHYVGLLILQPGIVTLLGYGLGLIGVIIGIVELAMVLEHSGQTIRKGKTLSYKNIDKGITGKNKVFNVIKPERELHTKAIGVNDDLSIKIHTEPMVIQSKKGPIEIEAPYVVREGLPQGLSMSPVLATLTMEMFKNPTELTLFADDGVYIGENIDKFKKGKQDISLVGAEISEEKSRMVTDGKFKFLGCEINIYKEQLEYNGKVLSGNDEMLGEKLQKIYNEKPYRKEPKGGTGRIKNDSVTAMNYRDIIDMGDFPIIEYLIVVGMSLVGGLPHKGYRIFKGCGIIDILGSSSLACNILAKSKNELNLVAIKPLCPIFKGKLSNYCMNKGTYYEEIYENNLRNYMKQQLPGFSNVMENYGDH